jgi:hypothetical protein
MKTLNLRPETIHALAKLTLEDRNKVMKVAGNLVKAKAERMLRAKNKLTTAIQLLPKTPTS